MITIHVTDRDGVKHQCQTETGGSLMQALTQHNYGVDAICGGCCSCATCHVYIDNDNPAFFDNISDDEAELLEYLPSKRSNSRLSCQIDCTVEMDNLEVTVAPAED